MIGGAGYIGSVLAGRLLDGGYCVRVLDALLYDNAAAVSRLTTRAGFTFQRGDFCCESDLNQSMEGITDVVHLAALVGDPVCKKFPDIAKHINENGTFELIDRLDQFDIQRFIFMSTCSNYGLQPDDTPATEDTALNPQSLYAETKVKVEQRLLGSKGDFDYSVTVLRAATAYGLSPRMRFDLTVNEFTRELALGSELLVYDADTWRPYCHVDDICTAIRLVLESDRARVNGQVFNVGCDEENYTKRMIVDLICNLLPKVEIRYQTGSVDPRNYRVAFQRIRTVLGFQANHTVAEFASELIEVIRQGRFHQDIDHGSFRRNITPTYPSH